MSNFKHNNITHQPSIIILVTQKGKKNKNLRIEKKSKLIHSFSITLSLNKLTVKFCKNENKTSV